MRSIRNNIDNHFKRAVTVLDTDNSYFSEDQKKELLDILANAENEVFKFITMVELAEEVADIGLWEYNIADDTIYWSDETYRVWGYEPTDIAPTEKHFKERIHPEDAERVKQTYKQSLADNEEYHMVYRLQFPEGNIKFIEAFGRHVYDEDGNPISTIGTNQNVTVREKERRNIESSLSKYQTMLKEIHHRVKNNLGVLAGTMQLQLLEENDEQFKHKLLDSTNRIRTIANVHEQLYQSQDFNEIPLGKSIEKIASDLIQAMPLESEITLDIEYDDIYLSNQKSMTCSLLVNEIITNALKHAFDGEESGELSIRLQEDDDEYIHLSITDNGVGLPDDFQQNEDSSLGMDLIETLCQQLEASKTLESSEEGTQFSMRFPRQ